MCPWERFASWKTQRCRLTPRVRQFETQAGLLPTDPNPDPVWFPPSLPPCTGAIFFGDVALQESAFSS